MGIKRVGGTGSLKNEKQGPEKSFYVTGGKVLTPVVGFSGRSIFTPPEPAMRGVPKEPGTEPWPKSAGRKFSGGAAMDAFGLNKKGEGD